MSDKKKRKRRVETSKITLASVLVFCGIAFASTLAGWFYNLEDAPVILGIIAGIAVMVIRYYMRKAQAENIIKIQRTNKYTDAQIEKLIDLAERGTENTEG